tara:strand:+ start:4498 stop:4827 length:330 start_codon:yes stop_codon:yes gene_type:complete
MNNNTLLEKLKLSFLLRARSPGTSMYPNDHSIIRVPIWLIKVQSQMNVSNRCKYNFLRNFSLHFSYTEWHSAAYQEQHCRISQNSKNHAQITLRARKKRQRFSRIEFGG